MTTPRGDRGGRWPHRPSISALSALTLSALALAWAGGGCNRSAQSAAPPPMPPPAVTVAHPVQREVTEWDEYTGHLAASEMVEVRARVGGFLESAPFDEGSVVKQGDLLFVIDPRPFQAELDQARAEVQRAEAQLQNASDELARQEKLREGNATTEREYLNAKLAKQTAAAEVAARQAAARTAELNLEFSRVTAPITGRVSRKYVTAGNLINGGSGQSTLLTTITKIDPIYCYVDADERAVLKYQRLAREDKRRSARQGEKVPARMALADEDDTFPHAGYIDFIDNRLDPGTGTLTARATFANPDGRLTPGLFARLRVPGSAPYQAVLVADAAIGTDQGQKYVLVVGADNVVQYRKVTTGVEFEGLRVVEGVTTDDWVVVNGLMQAHPNAPVTPQQAAMPGRATTRPSIAPVTTQPATRPADTNHVAGADYRSAADAFAPPVRAAASAAAAMAAEEVRQ